MKKKIIIGISIIFVIAVMGLVVVSMKTDKPTITYTEDELKFKNEYENINGTNYNEDNIYKTVNIENDNNVVYVNDSEILKLLEEGTNIIYFGWPECNWCRSIVPTLLETIKENEIDTLYYYNFKSLRVAYENNNDPKKVEIYESIIKIIGEDIETTFDKDSDRSGEKKILAPTVVFIKDGKYVGLHVKTVDSHLKSSDELDEKQLLELKNIYQDLINKVKLEVCYEEGC